jgi:hypothetical protein
LQRAQSDDISRHADLCSNPLILNSGEQTPPIWFSCTKAALLTTCNLRGITESEDVAAFDALRVQSHSYKTASDLNVRVTRLRPATPPGLEAESMLEVALGLGGAYMVREAVEFATSARTGPMTPSQAAVSRGLRCQGHFIQSSRIYCVANARLVCRVGVTRGTCILGLDRNRETVLH